MNRLIKVDYEEVTWVMRPVAMTEAERAAALERLREAYHAALERFWLERAK
jgi:hypothetical protein